MTSEAQNTKDALVATAHCLFAERGYDGVSIAEIAGSLGITKQALLHHFGSKEKLYGLVLEDLSKRFDVIVRPHLEAERPASEQFLAILRDLYRILNNEMHDARLIVRDLLDNQGRIAEKQKWYLRPF
ncbi:MAG: helix-turn-helix domain-containing protein, partial [Pseudomonadota bacterium]